MYNLAFSFNLVNVLIQKQGKYGLDQTVLPAQLAGALKPKSADHRCGQYGGKMNPEPFHALVLGMRRGGGVRVGVTGQEIHTQRHGGEALPMSDGGRRGRHEGLVRPTL